MNTLNTTAAEHFFWYCQSAKELAEMLRYSFDLTPEGTEKFNLAQKRFDLARTRAQREFKLFSSAYADATGDNQTEGTGNTL